MIRLSTGVVVVSTAKCLYLVASLDSIVFNLGLGVYDAESQLTEVGSVVMQPRNFNLYYRMLYSLNVSISS